MYYAEYNNSNEEEEISKKIKKEYYAEYAEYTNSNEDEDEDEDEDKDKDENHAENEEDNKQIVNIDDDINPVYDNYYKPQSGFCDMSFGGLIKDNKTSTIIIPVNADLNYDSDCKMGYNTTLLIPVTVPEITKNSPLIIIPVVTQQNVDKNNNNIISTATRQPILEAKIENDKIIVTQIDKNNMYDYNNKQIVTSVTNVNETPHKIEATTITSLPIKTDDNKKVVTESNVINTDISGNKTKINTNILISQKCLNGTLECDIEQQVNNVKSDVSDNYTVYSESLRTVVDLSSGEITVYNKNDSQNILSVPTSFINNNLDISNNITLVNDNSSLKVVIPSDSPTIVKVDATGQVINTTSQPIKVITKDPYIVQTVNERFTVNNIEGCRVTPIFEHFVNGKKDILPNINTPILTTY